MDSLKAIYKILERLDKAMDEQKSNFNDISECREVIKNAIFGG